MAWGAGAGNRAAWAQIYDRYADPLHDYCYSILRDRQEAADALHEAFLTAATKIGQLRDLGRLRPWLYAICRTQALAMATPGFRELPVGEAADLTPTPADDSGSGEAEQLCRLAWNALGALAPKDRAVLDLYLRHGMDERELGEVLNVKPHHAALLLSRVREHAERSLSPLLVSQSGRGDCSQLNGLLVDWDGNSDPLLPKRAVRHIEGCAVCRERRERMASPLTLLAGVPLLPAPLELREPVLDGVELRSTRQALAAGADDGAGQATERTERRWPAAVAGVLVALILMSALVFAIFRPGQPLAGPPSPSSLPVTSGTSSPAGPSPLVSIIGPLPTLTEPTSTSTTTARTTTARTTTTTTTERQDNQPPEISNVSADKREISFRSGSSCNTTEATARVTGQSSLNVVLVWETASGGSYQSRMSPRPGNRFTATIGPVQAINDGPVRWGVVATDSSGGRSQSAQQSVQVVANC